MHWDLFHGASCRFTIPWGRNTNFFRSIYGWLSCYKGLRVVAVGTILFITAQSNKIPIAGADAFCTAGCSTSSLNLIDVDDEKKENGENRRLIVHVNLIFDL